MRSLHAWVYPLAPTPLPHRLRGTPHTRLGAVPPTPLLLEEWSAGGLPLPPSIHMCIDTSSVSKLKRMGPSGTVGWAIRWDFEGLESRYSRAVPI